MREEGWESEYSQDFRVGGQEEGWFREPGGERYVNAPSFRTSCRRPNRVRLHHGPRDGANLRIAHHGRAVAEGGGTRLLFTEQIALLDEGDTADQREAGWRGLLDKLGEELASG